ncbi:MAG TPA: GNAT family protein [Gemmatimonadales bacterium]|nr:GNAT family protein [Gemmatimonadales bacterium]
MRLELPVAGAVLRPWERGDAVSLVRHADSRAVWINLGDRFPHPYRRADADRWIEAVTGQDPAVHFAIVVNGEAVGGIGLELQADIWKRTAVVGFWLGQAHWGRGIATAALQAVTEHAFGAFDLCRMQAYVFEHNAASMRVLEKAGYVREARLRKAATKDGRTFDLLVYALVR